MTEYKVFVGTDADWLNCADDPAWLRENLLAFANLQGKGPGRLVVHPSRIETITAAVATLKKQLGRAGSKMELAITTSGGCLSREMWLSEGDD